MPSSGRFGLWVLFALVGDGGRSGSSQQCRTSVQIVREYSILAYFARVEVRRVVLGEDFSFRHVGGIGLVLGEEVDEALHGGRAGSFEKMSVRRV